MEAVLIVRKSPHPIFKQSRRKRNHFFHWNLSPVGNPLAVKQDNAVVES